MRSGFSRERKAVNFQTLGLDPRGSSSSLRDRLGNAYERLAGTNDYQKNENNQKLIQFSVVTVSAIATGFVNSLAHVNRLGWPLAILLAVLIVVFVEKFFFTLRHGLTTCYKSGAQRLYAQLWYRILQATMVLNVALLSLWIFGVEPPAWLLFYNHYSLAIHFAAALIGVTMVRDADPVVQNRMLELRAQTAAQDIITIQRAAAIGSPVVLTAARVRGFFDGCGLALKLLFRSNDFTKEALAELDALQPKAIQSSRRPGVGFTSESKDDVLD